VATKTGNDAARYLEKHKQSPDIEPSKAWDESILGLLNYPEVIDKMNSDLDWTWKLGEAVVDPPRDFGHGVKWLAQITSVFDVR